MAFTLYKNDPNDPPRKQVSFDDLSNKAFWCRHGEDMENAFVATMSKIDSPYKVIIHPEKLDDPYHPDLQVDINGEKYIGEAKIKNSPLFFANRYKVNPQYALTMDLKDSFNYCRLLKQGIDLMIFIWVKWEAHEMVTEYHGKQSVYKVKPMRGIWVTQFSKLRTIELSESPPGIHWYKEHFRKPPVYNFDSNLDELTTGWCKSLVNLDPRLKEGNSVKNITSKGFLESHGEMYPSGHSSGSYVFDLSDKKLFEQIYFRI